MAQLIQQNIPIEVFHFANIYNSLTLFSSFVLSYSFFQSNNDLNEDDTIYKQIYNLSYEIEYLKEKDNLFGNTYMYEF